MLGLNVFFLRPAYERALRTNQNHISSIDSIALRPVWMAETYNSSFASAWQTRSDLGAVRGAVAMVGAPGDTAGIGIGRYGLRAWESGQREGALLARGVLAR